MSTNENLHGAKNAKKDEFYTQLVDIEKELKFYKHHFEGKIVFCNCDDPYESNFFKYFAMNFNYLKLKKLIATCYATSPVSGNELDLHQKHAYKIEISFVPDINNDGAIDLSDVSALLMQSTQNVLTELKGDGDFRSDECVELLKQADIVVTNPPFSLFREYVAQLMAHNKSFVIIGNQNAITYKEIFPLLQKNKIWLGMHSGAQEFVVPQEWEKNNTYIDKNGVRKAKFGNICWFTNLDIPRKHEELVLYKSYYGNEKEYPKYDNYDAINVDRVSDIPCDYFECVGVPISYLDKHNPEQFEIVKFRKGNDEKDLTYTIDASDNALQTDRQTDRQTDYYSILQNTHQAQSVMVSSECQSHSLTSSTQNNLFYLEQQKVKEKDSRQDCGMLKAECHNQLFVAKNDISDCLSNAKCNGIMGVPITFLDKFNPDQFEIIGIANSARYIGLFPCYTVINGKKIYNRILIKRKATQ